MSAAHLLGYSVQQDELIPGPRWPDKICADLLVSDGGRSLVVQVGCAPYMSREYSHAQDVFDHHNRKAVWLCSKTPRHNCLKIYRYSVDPETLETTIIYGSAALRPVDFLKHAFDNQP